MRTKLSPSKKKRLRSLTLTVKKQDSISSVDMECENNYFDDDLVALKV